MPLYHQQLLRIIKGLLEPFTAQFVDLQMESNDVNNSSATSVSTRTIKEVALQAGVSTATVSRVINKTCHVAPSTRDAVLDVVRRLAYKPNSAAVELGRKRPGRGTRKIVVFDSAGHASV